MNIWIVAAHYDDEVLGCGGIIAKWHKEHNIYVSFLTDSSSTQYANNEKAVKTKVLEQKLVEDMFGLKVQTHTFSDMRLDEKCLVDVVGSLEYYVPDKPDMVFTHSIHDTNADHKVAHEATKIVCRRLKTTLLAYEIVDYYPSFCPDYYVDITGVIDLKVSAFKTYTTEWRDKPDSRNTETIFSLARIRGAAAGCNYAEAFETIRRNNA